MSRGLQWFVGLVTAIFIVVGVLLFLVRSHDGPMEILSGGPLKTGELVSGVTDWEFIDQFKTIELQTMQPPRSRTMWLVVHDNRMFVLSSYMNTHFGKLWKQWPRRVAEDNRALVRADGKLYELQLVRHLKGEFIQPVLDRFNEKYHRQYSPQELEKGNAWLFELTAR